jgi:hypothetical protein
LFDSVIDDDHHHNLLLKSNINMVKRSRSAAQLPSDAHADLVLDNVDPPIVQEPSEAHGVELIEDARTHRPAINRTVDAEPPLVASGSSFTSATCALGESNRIKSPQSNYQLFDRTLSVFNLYFLAHVL